MLSPAAIEGYKQYTDREIAYAKYKIGDTWHKVPISRRERLADGKIAVYFSIIPEAGQTVTISGVQLFNTNNAVWAEKTENILIESVQEGVLYRFTFDLREDEQEV